jgi:hypothetical protein
LALQGPIREALVVLEPVEHLCEDLFEGHTVPLRLGSLLGVPLLGLS